MLLTDELAQQVVDHIMPTASQNINIMNDQGIIIASGHKHRLHTFHKGAKDVLEQGKMIEIYPADVTLYPGSLPGLNMPIVLNNHIIGVVGVSGHPDEVRSTAKMIKMVTELILEREILREDSLSHSQLQKQFVTLLCSDRASENYEKLMKAAKLLNYELDLPRLVLTVNLKPILDQAIEDFGLTNLVLSRTRECLEQALTNSTSIKQQDFVAFLDKELIILKHFPLTTPVNCQKQWGTDIYEIIHAVYQDVPIKIGLGSLVPAYNELSLSYQESRYCVTSRNSQQKIASIHDADILCEYLVNKINTVVPCLALSSLKAQLEGDLSQKYDMKNTIIHLLNHHLNITCTAKSLYIHRNTLLFRLKRLQDTTGLEPCHVLSHALLCKMLLNT